MTAPATEAVAGVHPAAALFAFMGWVTCRKEAVTLGAQHDAAPAAQLVSEFIDSQGWGNPPEGWTDTLKPYPSPDGTTTLSGNSLDDELELAWGIIANAGGGDWTTQSQEWRDAAARWRDRVMPGLGARAQARAVGGLR